MKKSRKFLFLVGLTIMSSAVSAKSITATGSTIDSAEAKIANKADSAGMSYKIIGGNYVYMIAKLIAEDI